MRMNEISDKKNESKDTKRSKPPVRPEEIFYPNAFPTSKPLQDFSGTQRIEQLISRSTEKSLPTRVVEEEIFLFSKLDKLDHILENFIESLMKLGDEAAENSIFVYEIIETICDDLSEACANARHGSRYARMSMIFYRERKQMIEVQRQQYHVD